MLGMLEEEDSMKPTPPAVKPPGFPPEEKGMKYDNQKTRWELMPYDALDEVADVLTFGAQKYADRNWEKGINYSRVLGAAARHISAFHQGVREDEETGLHPLAHAACEILFALAFEKRGMTQFDDLREEGAKVTIPVPYEVHLTKEGLVYRPQSERYERKHGRATKDEAHVDVRVRDEKELIEEVENDNTISDRREDSGDS